MPPLSDWFPDSSVLKDLWNFYGLRLRCILLNPISLKSFCIRLDDFLHAGSSPPLAMELNLAFTTPTTSRHGQILLSVVQPKAIVLVFLFVLVFFFFFFEEILL